MYLSNEEHRKLRKWVSSMQKQGKSSGSQAEIHSRLSDFFQQSFECISPKSVQEKQNCVR